MSKKRIDRDYYRNGQIRQENRLVGGELHGLCRAWHYNGRLAEERRYHHGQLHGGSRQWDENGHLLGTFTMNHGTGKHCCWHNNGRLKLEINSLKGKFWGRMRLWLADGTLVQESYYVSNRDVTRAAYLKAAQKHPDWPRFQGEPAGRVARETSGLRRKQHELFTKSLLEKSHAEAKEWLTHGQPANRRSLAKFRTQGAALRFVEELSAAGADRTIVAPIYKGKRGKLFADSLLVKLPRILSKRKAVRKICQDLCRRQQGALLPEKDINESHLFLGLE